MEAPKEEQMKAKKHEPDLSDLARVKGYAHLPRARSFADGLSGQVLTSDSTGDTRWMSSGAVTLCNALSGSATFDVNKLTGAI